MPRLPLATSLESHARREIVAGVRSLFNDQARGEKPVAPSDDALFLRGSVIWRVHGDVTSMMIGGVSALLLQMLHPAVLAGVWDHSNFRNDMLGRLRRTARFIALTTYGSKQDAAAAIERVNEVHRAVAGQLPDGTAYAADDPRLLAWVHVAEATRFLAAWQRYGRTRLSLPEQDRYFAQFAVIAERLGASPVPRSTSAAEALIRTMRSELNMSPRTREVAAILLSQHPPNPLALPVQTVTFKAAVNLLPEWARRMHGFRTEPLFGPLVDVAALGIAGTVRWAFSSANRG
jgi:uncharacterized protein (DUF2236 family)